ncbi:DUF3857 domain-containing protein [Flavobacterium sedimenticola]|uniref:DUF3857 domain-containing protein n=1 Tax=Flavobacterium sedimenticola TaxID=3043286 RepID=A0ABT6XND0_9FLAO|nr:DUF3857 domain-containing protein [Flavobacterium sedimenticola]MDI9256591.1 DUF3857 domain-containing protein [Flavobacterium sedimenticola]
MNKYFFTLTVLLVCFNLSAQKKELGEVTIEELQERKCPNDTAAVAAVLFNVGKTYFDYDYDDGFQIITEISTKIKIYKKEGYDLANYAVAYYDGGNEKVSFAKTVTYNLVNGKIEKTKLGSDGIFIEKINNDYKRKKITMPNVKEGSIIEYKVEIKSPFIWNFPEWEFQKNIPVKYSEYTTFIPEYYIYNTHLKGFLTPVTTQDGKIRKINYTYKTNMMPGMSGQSSERVNSTLEFNEKIVKYVLSDVPALKEEAFANNINNYRTTLLHELSGKRVPNMPHENFTTDWESVTKKIYDQDSFGSELNKNGYYENDLNTLLNGITSHEEKIATVFTYVKSRMNWDGFYGYSCNDGVRKAYIDKKGNVGEINLMLTSMLRYAGVEANPILLSTRSNGIAIFPSQSAFNYVICGVELQNQVVLLDATNKYALPNILPIRDLNWFGRIIRKNGSSSEINLMPTSNSKDIVNIMASLDTEGKVKGKVREQHFDYNAFLHRDNYAAIAKDSYIERMEKIHKGLEVEEYEVQNVNDLGKPVVENYTFSADGSVEIIGDKIYFSPFLFFALEENPFKQETREYPIDFVFPQQDKYNINIGIPDGYIVETLPQPKAVAMPDNLGSVKYNISVNGNQIQTLYSLDINQAIISNEYYDALKSFFKEIIAKQTEKIVLKKV